CARPRNIGVRYLGYW
nr:immunoglobulin heavy chain junction region [Macaca mulatta]MOX64103.1 immunoglobulin heavy chain junction region [Macaca mulatta]MOX67160.1 immunoglobulin heavy chain junction region [Macaca mulatta]MOX68410.1 immunoglobulin heavy chain junction region [Macaca mulatta]MOX68790.1 immunoglobulin heavy chain junction region [Macaca mulatta]